MDFGKVLLICNLFQFLKCGLIFVNVNTTMFFLKKTFSSVLELGSEMICENTGFYQRKITGQKSQ